MYFGWSNNGAIAKKAGLKRSMCPTCAMTCASLASLMRLLLSSKVEVIGFSMNTCFKLRMALEAHWKCEGVLDTTSTTSTSCISASRLWHGSIPKRAAASLAALISGSKK